MQPKFPEFKPVELQDCYFIQEILHNYQPQTSEWTFTNLFIWRNHYQFQWTTYQNNLIVLCANKGFYFLPPIGSTSRLELIRFLLKWLKNDKAEKDPRIEKADQRLVKELEGADDLLVEPTRDQFDYVYRTEDLIKLAGRKFHRKKNHVNNFLSVFQIVLQ